MVTTGDGTRRPTPGGGPFNTARALARLEVPAAFLGHFSTDEFGRLLADQLAADGASLALATFGDRKSTRLNSSHSQISYAVFCLKKKKKNAEHSRARTPSHRSHE